MANLLLKKLNQKINNLEKQLVKLERSVNSRNNLNVPTDASIIKVQLNEDVPERYMILKVVHNELENTYARGILFGSSHADNELANFIPAIALSPGSSGDHIMAKIEGASFALTNPSTDVYGAEDQIKAGDKLKVDSVAGLLEKGNNNSVNFFTALESRHVSESIIRVKFAKPR